MFQRSIYPSLSNIQGSSGVRVVYIAIHQCVAQEHWFESCLRYLDISLRIVAILPPGVAWRCCWADKIGCVLDKLLLGDQSTSWLYSNIFLTFTYLFWMLFTVLNLLMKPWSFSLIEVRFIPPWVRRLTKATTAKLLNHPRRFLPATSPYTVCHKLWIHYLGKTAITCIK